MLQALDFLQTPSAFGLGLFLALAGLGGEGLLRQLLLAQTRLFLCFGFRLFFGLQSGLPGLFLLLAGRFGRSGFAHACAPRLLIQLSPDRGLRRNRHGLAFVSDRDIALTACLHAAGQGAGKALGVLIAPGFFLGHEFITTGQGPLDLPVLGAALLGRRVKPLVTHPVQLQSGAHALRLGGAHGRESIAPGGLQRRMV